LAVVHFLRSGTRTATSTCSGAPKAKLPEDAHHIEKWRLALEMIDELTGWGIAPPVILGDGRLRR